jgi:hypothetical protein
MMRQLFMSVGSNFTADDAGKAVYGVASNPVQSAMPLAHFEAL